MLARILGLTFAVLTFSCSAQPSESVGRRSDAIISGTASGADQDAVVLFYQTARNQTCTATMVAPNLLVTARHCVGALSSSGTVTDHPADGIRIYTGRNALGKLRDDEDHPAAVGKELVVPSSTSLYPDVAFVVLDRALSTPVAVMRLGRGVAVGESVGVIGYGLDESGTRPDARMQRGGLVISQIGPGKSSIGERLDRGELVFGEAACSGDSGGPAFSEITGALVAIASRVGNGTPPNQRDPAAFCIGDTTNDVYTDFVPVADVTTRAFAAAGATPIVESSIEPANRGELASAHLEGDGVTTTVSGDAGHDSGCSASPIAPARSSSPACLLLAALAALSASRKAHLSNS